MLFLPDLLRLGPECFSEPECEDKCSTTYEQQCSTRQEQQCNTVNERQCNTVQEQKCNTVNEQKCNTVQERQCNTGDSAHILSRSIQLFWRLISAGGNWSVNPTKAAVCQVTLTLC